MPRLGKFRTLVNSVFFLYKSREDAEIGHKSGGTGFLVAVPSATFGKAYVYAVTNWHVACDGGSSVIRLNRRDGGIEIFDHDPSEWIFIPGKQDVAIMPIMQDLGQDHDISYIHSGNFLSEEDIRHSDVGVGDDIFMIGRFVDYDGEETNKPALRFGHISISSANIKQPTGHIGESVVVDMHSRTGFSGSPVIVYHSSGNNFDDFHKGGLDFSFSVGTSVWLLGIQWGCFPERWEIKERQRSIDVNDETTPSANLIVQGKYVEGLSGMSCVIPAKDILEVLNLPELVAKRQAADLVDASAVDTPAAVAQTAIPSEKIS